jgi:putative aldouronate transport system substrate-binding protein
MLKKVVSLILIFAVVALMAAGCTQTGTTTTGGTTTKAPTATTGTTSAEWALPYTGNTVTFTAFAADVGVQEDKESPVYKIYKNVVGNIEVEWELVPFSDFDTKANIYFNSGEIPDLIWYRSARLSENYSDSGLFLDLNKYKDYTPNWNISVEKNPGQLTYQTEKGEQFIMHGWDNDYPAELHFANKTLLDKMGIAIPTNLDEFAAACQKVLDMDATVTPFHTFWGTGYYLAIFSSLIRGYRGYRCDLDTGVWNHAILDSDSKYKELITLMADFYDKGYFNAEFSTMGDEQTTQLITSNKWAFTFTYTGQIDAWYNQNVTTEVVPYVYPVKTGEKPEVWPTYVSDRPGWGYSINAKISKPELACVFLDALLGDEIATAFQWGEEGTSYIINNQGFKEWIPSFLEDPANAAKIGIWNILTPRYITKRDDASSITRGSDLSKDAYKLMVNGVLDGSIDMIYYRLAPTFTTAEQEELSIINTAVNTVIDENQALFILGQRSLSEWDAFITEVKAAGNLERAVEIYNNAKQKPDRLTSDQRDIIKFW